MVGPLHSQPPLAELLPQRVAIVRALPGLGDLLCLVPALRALRSAFPGAQLTLIGLPSAQAFVQRYRHYLDQWLEFPGYPGIPEVPLSPSQIVAFLGEAQQWNFDLALQLHGNGSWINSFALLLGAKRCAGFFPTGYSCPDPNWFLAYPDQEPEIWRSLRLLEFLGVPLRGDRLEFPLCEADWQEFAVIDRLHALTGSDFICIHPGASVPNRCWSPQLFAIVADALAAQGWRIVLTGTATERSITQTVAQFMRFPALDLAGQTSLGAIAALLNQSRLVICNDTGISHLAAALQVNSVVIFTESDPQRWAPLDRDRHRPVIANRLSNSTTANSTTANSTAAVLAEANRLLQREVAYAS